MTTQSLFTYIILSLVAVWIAHSADSYLTEFQHWRECRKRGHVMVMGVCLCCGKETL